MITYTPIQQGRSEIKVYQNVYCIVRCAKTGRVLQVVESTNLLVSTGRNKIRDMLGGTGFRPDQLAIGSGTTAPAVGDTALETQTLKKLMDRRINQTFGIEFQTLIETGEGNGTTINEIGTFQGNTLISRAVLSSGIVKNSAIVVTVSHIHTVSSG